MTTKKELENELTKIKEQRKKQYNRQNEYNKQNYKRLSCNVKKELYSTIEKHCKDNKLSINGYIIELIKKDLDITE